MTSLRVNGREVAVCVDPATGMCEPGRPPLVPAFANVVARLTGKPRRQLPLAI